MRTQYQVQTETQIRKNQKVIKNDNIELVIKYYPKNCQPNIQNQQRIFKPTIVLVANKKVG